MTLMQAVATFIALIALCVAGVAQLRHIRRSEQRRKLTSREYRDRCERSS